MPSPVYAHFLATYAVHNSSKLYIDTSTYRPCAVLLMFYAPPHIVCWLALASNDICLHIDQFQCIMYSWLFSVCSSLTHEQQQQNRCHPPFPAGLSGTDTTSSLLNWLVFALQSTYFCSIFVLFPDLDPLKGFFDTLSCGLETGAMLCSSMMTVNSLSGSSSLQSWQFWLMIAAMVSQFIKLLAIVILKVILTRQVRVVGNCTIWKDCCTHAQKPAHSTQNMITHLSFSILP